MEFVKGLHIASANTLGRIRAAILWLVTKAHNLLLRLSLANIRLLAKIAAFVFDRRNRKLIMSLIATAGVVIAGRKLIDRADRRRLRVEGKRLFTKYGSQFNAMLTLDEEAEAELDNAARFVERNPRRHRQLMSLRQMEPAGERAFANTDRLTEIESTISGHSHEFDFKRLAHASKALSSRPSLYQQTKYLDEIEEILKRRRRTKHQYAEKFLHQLKLRKSEALADCILKESLSCKQEQPEFE